MHCIILKKNAFAEGNEIVTLFTREHGKIRGIARSVRSIKSKLAFGLQQLFYSDIELVKTKKNYAITGVRVLDSFKGIRSDLVLINLALYATELVIKSTPDEQQNEILFDLYLEFLRHLDSSGSRSADHSDSAQAVHACIGVFVFKVMQAIGYGISVESCAICGKVLAGDNHVGDASHVGGNSRAGVGSDSNVYFSNRHGGFICAEDAAKSSDAQNLPDGMYRDFVNAYAAAYIAQDSLMQPYAASLRQLADSFASYVLERDLKAGRFVV